MVCLVTTNQTPKDDHIRLSPSPAILILLPVIVLLCLVTDPTDAQSLRQYVLSQPVTFRQLYYQDMATVTVEPEDATCGMQGMEQICSLMDPQTCDHCLATDQTVSHPPSLILDSSGHTYWQSSPWVTYPSPFIINITLSLLGNKEYILAGDIIMRFRSTVPEAMVLEKSRDGGKTWLRYQYFSTNCTMDFNMVETKFNKSAANLFEAKCVNPNRMEANPHISDLTEVRFDLLGRISALIESQGGGAVEYFYKELERQDSTLRDFMTMTDLRLVLIRPAIGELEELMLDLTSRERLHYAIYSIDADLSCDCNLHGSHCELIMPTRLIQCNCLHHTEGQSCERCQAGYQALPWQPGSYLPFFMGTANECQESPTQAPRNSSTQSANTADPRACTPNPCLHGTCIIEDTAAGYKCSCDYGFTGYVCEIDLDPCQNKPCENAGFICVSESSGHFHCVPAVTFNGTDPPILQTTEAPQNTGLSGATIGIIIGTCVAIPLFCVWIVIMVWCTTWRHLHTNEKYAIKYTDEVENHFSNSRYKMGGAKSWLVPDGRSSMRAHKLRDRWIIEESCLELGKLIYSGEFSYICEGMFKNKEQDTSSKVVVKLLRDEKDIDSLHELRNEFEVMSCMGRHPNIVWLQGTCNRMLEETTQLCLVNEYVARGDMLRILRRCRSRRKDQPPYSPTPVEELLSFACDIAQGMRHITLLKYVHMNLCAKNVFITFNNKAKIGDFGMATELPESSGYVRYTEHRNKHVKRWMAYEALLEDVYSVKSDVWSFGTVLWEIITLGGMPYHNIKTIDLVGELRDHTRMEWPRHCSPEIYDLMLRCWHRRPESRPSFDMLCTELKKMKIMAKKHFNLKEYIYQTYIPVKLEEDIMDSVQDSTFV